jgi:hypothetical protein
MKFMRDTAQNAQRFTEFAQLAGHVAIYESNTARAKRSGKTYQKAQTYAVFDLPKPCGSPT